MDKLVLSSSVSRREFLRASAAVAGLATISACRAAVPAAAPAVGEAADSGGEAPAAAPIKVDVWTGWTEDAATNIEKILKGYNDSQGKVVATHVVVPDSMTQKLLAAISAGNPPSTAIVFGASIAYQLAAQKGLMAIDEVGLPDQVSTLKSWMDPAIWDLGNYDGKFYYASMWNQCMGCFVNTKMAEEKGIDPTAAPKTLEELDDVWEKLTTYDADGNIDVLGGDFNWLSMVLGRFLGTFLSDDGTKVTANAENNMRAVQWIADRWEKIGVKKMQDWNASLQGRGERSAGLDPWLAGLRATAVTGPWNYNTIKEFAPKDFEYTVWPFPGPAGQKTKGMHTYGDGFIIPVGSQSPSAAMEIISTLTGAIGDRDVYTSLFTAWQCVNGPVSRSMEKHPSFQSEVMGKCPGYQEIFLTDLFEADYYLYPPKIPTSDSYMSLLGSEAAKVWLGEKDVESALNLVQEQAQKELDTWMEQNKS